MAELLIWSAAALTATFTVHLLDVEAEPAFADGAPRAQHAAVDPHSQARSPSNADPVPELQGPSRNPSRGASLGRHPG